MSIKKYLSLLLLVTSSAFLYATDDVDIDAIVKKCNEKDVTQCIDAAEYYKGRLQLDLAHKFYKKACLLDSKSKSKGTFVCSITRSLESNFPNNLFR